MLPFLPTKVVSGRCRLWCDSTWIVVRPEANSMSMRLSRHKHGQRQEGRSHSESNFHFISQFHGSLLSLRDNKPTENVFVQIKSSQDYSDFWVGPINTADRLKLHATHSARTRARATIDTMLTA